MKSDSKKFGAVLAKGVRKTFAEMADLVVPNICCNCMIEKTSEGPLCDNCKKQLLYSITLPYCPRCGSTLGPNITSDISQGCFSCPTPMHRFAAVYRLGQYDGLLRETIKQIKFHRRWVLVKPLAGLLAQRILADGSKFDMIAPVPMFWTRRLMRGCNHSTLLAKHLSAELDTPMFRLVRRSRNTALQTMSSKTQRHHNVKGAFTISSVDKGLVGMKILLVDDISTTGATADEVTRMLKQCGASRVELAVLAKSCKNVDYEKTK